MPTTRLNDRAILTVTGEDAPHLLQNILTTDIGQLGTGEALPGALLSPQGKILFDFLISRVEGGFRLDCRADVAEDFRRRLMLYKLRAKAEISQPEQPSVGISWGDDSDRSGDDSTALADRRFPEAARAKRHYGEPPPADAEADEWHALRVEHGIAESGADYALGDAFPHDVLLDQMRGVDFRKGCYVGQEVVSRMHHRGTARRRVLVAKANVPLPPAGTEVTAGGRALGALGTVAGDAAIAIVRIDRVKSAMDAQAPIRAGEAEVTLSIPAWAGFAFPADADTAPQA